MVGETVGPFFCCEQQEGRTVPGIEGDIVSGKKIHGFLSQNLFPLQPQGESCEVSH